MAQWKASGQPPDDSIKNKNPLEGLTNQPERKAFFVGAEGESSSFSEALILKAISQLSAYLREERDRYRPQGRRLTPEEINLFGKFFSPNLLRQVRLVALVGRLLPNPPFFERARALGINVPDMAHKASTTFLDVVVFSEQMTARKLFHALVHAAQAHVLGTRFFTELFVRGVFRARSYTLSPMKAHAFALDARFATNPKLAFSVEDEVREWLDEARY